LSYLVEMLNTSRGAGTPDTVLLQRHIAGECSDAECAQLEQWLAADPEHARQLESLRAVIKATARVGSSRFDTRAARRRVAKRIQDAEESGQLPETVRQIVAVERTRPAHVQWLTPTIGAWAAGLLVAIGAIWTVYTGASHRRPVFLANEAVEYSTTVGQRVHVTLRDGTQFILAPASRVRLAADYGRARRDIYLDGEAYFAVSHDGARPFTVHAGNAMAEDLGTRFGVRSYHGDAGVQVVVAEGKVALQSVTARQRAASVLTSGTLGLVDNAGDTHVTYEVSTARYLEWTTGHLTFKNTELREVLPELARWYGLNVELDDSTLARLPLTASFADVPTSDIVAALAASLDVRYERHGQTVRLFPRRVSRSS